MSAGRAPSSTQVNPSCSSSLQVATVLGVLYTAASLQPACRHVAILLPHVSLRDILLF